MGARVRISVWTAIWVCGGCVAGSRDAGNAPTVAAPAQRPELEYREIDVTIPARGIELEGTLAVPEADGPRPAIVLIHGSGPLGRDENLPGQLGVKFGFDVPVFEQLAAGLARAGYVVIRYDKRTCTPAEGCDNHYPDVDELHFDDLVADAQSVIDWLRARPEVDAGALYVIGHSQGGTYVPELMLDNPDLRAGALLATPFRPIDELAAYQADYVQQLLRHRDTHPLVIGVRLRLLRTTAEGLQALRTGTSTKELIGDAPAVYWQEWLESGDALPALVDRLDRPLLAVSGELDTNVPPSETELWRARLAAVHPNPGHVAIVLPCITHALNCVRRSRDGREAPERHIAPELLAEILGFLAR